MGKKKKPAKQNSAKVAADHGHGRGQDREAGAGPEAEEDAEADAGSPAWLAEQQRLLEMYSSKAPGNAASSSGSGGGALLAEELKHRELTEEDLAMLCRLDEAVPSTKVPAPPPQPQAEGFDEAHEAVIEKQRRLLEEAASASKSSASGGQNHRGGGEETFAVRRVDFCGRKVPMLLQNRNGPCALLAVANGLLLRGTLTLRDDEASLTSGALVERLAQLCTRLNEKSAREDANTRESITEVIGRLPSLLDGLLLNCGFSSCSDFEPTAELGLFDCLGLRLFHAWVAPEVAAVTTGWNQLAEQLAVCSELQGRLEQEGRAPSPKEDEQLAKGIWLEQWLEEHRAQATNEGLHELLGTVGEREVCVLFRNNHFSTIYKPSKEALCVLLTDAAFECEAAAVWESLELDGSTGCILRADFKPAEASDHEAVGEERREELISLVTSMGFGRDVAEAGLVAVDWTSAEEALEAILEADGGMPAPRKKAAAPSCGGFSEVHSCSTCGKVFRSKNGMLNHRVSKGH